MVRARILADTFKQRSHDTSFLSIVCRASCLATYSRELETKKILLFRRQRRWWPGVKWFWATVLVYRNWRLLWWLNDDWQTRAVVGRHLNGLYLSHSSNIIILFDVVVPSGSTVDDDSSSFVLYSIIYLPKNNSKLGIKSSSSWISFSSSMKNHFETLQSLVFKKTLMSTIKCFAFSFLSFSTQTICSYRFCFKELPNSCRFDFVLKELVTEYQSDAASSLGIGSVQNRWSSLCRQQQYYYNPNTPNELSTKIDQSAFEKRITNIKPWSPRQTPWSVKLHLKQGSWQFRPVNFTLQAFITHNLRPCEHAVLHFVQRRPWEQIWSALSMKHLLS